MDPFIFLLFLLWLLLIAGAFSRKKKVWNPFKNIEVFSYCECKKCGKKFTVHWRRGDYVGKKLNKERGCCGTTYIIGIFTERKKTKKEQKWEEYVKKFR